MNLRRQQTGMSVLGLLVMAMIAGFFILCIIRLSPPYFEYLSIKNIVEKTATEHVPGEESLDDIRRKIATSFNTNQIYELKPRDVQVYREKGVTRINANYEVRVPIVWRIDAVLKLDDLEFIAGN